MGENSFLIAENSSHFTWFIIQHFVFKQCIFLKTPYSWGFTSLYVWKVEISAFHHLCPTLPNLNFWLQYILLNLFSDKNVLSYFSTGSCVLGNCWNCLIDFPCLELFHFLAAFEWLKHTKKVLTVILNQSLTFLKSWRIWSILSSLKEGIPTSHSF